MAQMDSKSSKFKGMKMPMPAGKSEAGMDDMFGQSDEEMANELDGDNAAADMAMKPNPAMTKFTDEEVMAEFKARGLDSMEEAGEMPMEESAEEEAMPA